MSSSVSSSVAESLASTIEAILYLKGQPLTLAEIADYSGYARDVVQEALLALMGDYAQRDTALEVVETNKGYTLQLRDRFQPLVERLIPADLGVAALRTLAVIALKGPLPMADLIDLRGSGAYQHVQELVERDFVKKRRYGRSSLVQVSDKFHRYFQLDVGNQSSSQLELALSQLRSTLPTDERSPDAEPIGDDFPEDAV
ncbi:MAG TPA: SMC-Scp complex subunit ScpB [Coleofasciculaceae cyanobacterium]